MKLLCCGSTNSLQNSANGTGRRTRVDGGKRLSKTPSSQSVVLCRRKNVGINFSLTKSESNQYLVSRKM